MATSAANTVVGSSNGLQINLIWDASVKNNANWAAIEASVISAASAFTNVFSSKIMVNIGVEVDAVNGHAFSSGAVASSQSYYVLADYGTTVSALAKADTFLGSAASVTANLTANNAPSASPFGIHTAEAKALGLISATNSGYDGYIGISSNEFYAAAGVGFGAKIYDATGSAAHEISEVLGRSSDVGKTATGYYSPLDLFRYSANGVRSLGSADGAYFSVDNGTTALAKFNNGNKNDGDSGDWATTTSNPYDSFNAFGSPGQLAHISPTDFLALEALGYQVNTVGIPKADVVLA